MTSKQSIFNSIKNRNQEPLDSSRGSWSTSDPTGGSGFNYSAQALVMFGLTTIMTVFVLVVVLSVVWENEFQEYTRENMQSLATSTADSLGEAYGEYGYWTSTSLSAAEAASSISKDVGIQVVNESETVIYDDTWIQRGTDKPAATTNSPLVATNNTVAATIYDEDGKEIGTVYIWAYGSNALMTTGDTEFRKSSYMAISAASLIAIAIALIIGRLFARHLVRPVALISAAAGKIKNGDLSARTDISGDDELSRLGEVFDEMAAAIEKDRDNKRELITNLAHEIRTPLMVMRSNIEAMEDGIYPTDTEHLEIVEDEVLRLSRLVEAMVHVSKIDNGELQPKFAEADMVDLIQGLVVSQSMLVQDAGLEMKFENKTGKSSLYVPVDKDMIKQAAINLISNAMRYTPAPGSITVRIFIDKEKKKFVIAVDDTGIGIAEDDLKKIFDRFWRAEASRNRATAGLGVGLNVTKNIIEKHNGFITIESELGVGTTFALNLPLERDGFTQ